MKTSEAQKRWSSRWSKANPEKQAAATRRFNWKKDKIINLDGSPFTMADYDKNFDKQNGRCKMCNTHQSELKKTLAVDHDHKTNLFRGLLCGPCNIGLGYYEKVRVTAETYLQKFA